MTVKVSNFLGLRYSPPAGGGGAWTGAASIGPADAASTGACIGISGIRSTAGPWSSVGTRGAVGGSNNYSKGLHHCSIFLAACADNLVVLGIVQFLKTRQLASEQNADRM